MVHVLNDVVLKEWVVDIMEEECTYPFNYNDQNIRITMDR